MLAPTHDVDPRDREVPCLGCHGPCRAGDLTRLGICPDCHGTHACRYCGTVEVLDASGHCEHCCDGVFVPADAHADSPALDALPWESPWLPAAAEACAAA